MYTLYYSPRMTAVQANGNLLRTYAAYLRAHRQALLPSFGWATRSGSWCAAPPRDGAQLVCKLAGLLRPVKESRKITFLHWPQRAIELTDKLLLYYEGVQRASHQNGSPTLKLGRSAWQCARR